MTSDRRIHLAAFEGDRWPAAPTPSGDEIVVRVHASGVGLAGGPAGGAAGSGLPMWMRSGIAGVVDDVSHGVAGFAAGEEVFGVTIPRLIRSGAATARVRASRLARKPQRIDFALAAAIPGVAVAAWQMLFALGRLERGETVLVLGATQPVGLFAVQLARACGVSCIAQCAQRHAAVVRALGADRVIDASPGVIEAACARAAVIVDAVGGMLQRRAACALRPGAALVSSVSRPDPALVMGEGACCELCVPQVTALRLRQIARLIDLGLLTPTLDTLFGLSAPGRAARADAHVGTHRAPAALAA